MPIDIRAQVILHTTDNVQENYVTNSWCFQVPSALGSTGPLTTALKDFYDDLIAADWSLSLAQNGHQIKYSLLPGTPPNYPFDEDVFNFAAAPNGSQLPSELALCMSFQADRVAGFPQARRRGRVYIGPLGITTNTSGRPTSAVISRLATAGATLKSNVAALGADYAWAVWSVADQASVKVKDGWVDNAFDVQRRRGLAYSSRTTFV